MFTFIVTTLTLLVAVPVAADKKADAPKILAKASSNDGGRSGVIRTPSDEKTKAHFAKQLKVDAIDWKKQMVIFIAGGQQRTGGYSVEVKSLEVKDRKLIVHWKLNAPDGIATQVISYPALMILVDRFEGDVVFDPAPPAEKKRGQ